MRQLIRMSVVMVLFVSTVFMPSSIFAVNYDNQNPQSNGCVNDAVTPSGSSSAWVISSKAYVEVRWSATCKANWARVTITDGQIRTITTWLEDSSGNKYREITESGYLQAWTNTRVDNGTKVKACAKVGSSSAVCTWGYY